MKVPIEIYLMRGPEVINAKSFDSRSTATMLVVIGMDDEVIVIDKTSIAAMRMQPEAAEAYFA